MGAELPRNSLSVAKEGKVFEQKKLLQPLLGTHEGTKITGTILFCTSPTLTVYSTVRPGGLHLGLPQLQQQWSREKAEDSCDTATEKASSNCRGTNETETFL